jgi:putative membrane protein
MAEPPRPAGGDPGAPQRTAMAAERTWLAWWRTALAATAGALAVGRLAPELLDVAPWPYVVLGAGYAVLAIGLLLAGAHRMRQLDAAVRSGEQIPLRFWLVAVFTGGGVLLALTTMVLVIAQT